MNLIGRAYQKIVRESDSLLRETGGRAGIYDQLYRNANGGRIVVYHGICKKDPTRFSPVFLKQETLDAHLKFYKKYFNVISLDDFFEQGKKIEFQVIVGINKSG